MPTHRNGARNSARARDVDDQDVEEADIGDVWVCEDSPQIIAWMAANGFQFRGHGDTDTPGIWRGNESVWEGSPMPSAQVINALARAVDRPPLDVLDEIGQTVTLADVPTIVLLGEIDRRAREALPPDVEFFGVWPGSPAGHHRRDRHGAMVSGGETIDGRGKLGLYPWDVWHGPAAPQTEGIFWHWHHPVRPMTLLLSWDRSADSRGGCAASFIIAAHVTAERAMQLARETFPAVFDRIERHIGRVCVLGGPVS